MPPTGVSTAPAVDMPVDAGNVHLVYLEKTTAGERPMMPGAAAYWPSYPACPSVCPSGLLLMETPKGRVVNVQVDALGFFLGSCSCRLRRP